MQSTDAAQRFQALEQSKKSDNYNFEHFKTKILLHDAQNH